MNPKTLEELFDHIAKEALQHDFLQLGAALQDALEDLFEVRIDYVLVLRNPKKQVLSLGTMSQEEQIEVLKKAIEGLKKSDYKYGLVNRKTKEIQVKTKQQMQAEAERETKH